MASHILKIIFIILVPFYAVAAEKCLSCHESHYGQLASCNACHRGTPESSRKELAHYKLIPGDFAGYLIPENIETEKGKKIIEAARCSRCHTIGGEGGLWASNLDSSATRLSSRELMEAVKTPNEAMPDFALGDKGLKSLMNALYFYATKGTVKEITQTIHFSEIKKEKVFPDKCGGCHKALSEEGAAGTRPLAPNLSGMAGEYSYLIEGKKWDKELLKKWLENPRSIKPTSTMPPIPLTNEELTEAVKVLIK